MRLEERYRQVHHALQDGESIECYAYYPPEERPVLSGDERLHRELLSLTDRVFAVVCLRHPGHAAEAREGLARLREHESTDRTQR